MAVLHHCVGLISLAKKFATGRRRVTSARAMERVQLFGEEARERSKSRLQGRQLHDRCFSQDSFHAHVRYVFADGPGNK